MKVELSELQNCRTERDMDDKIEEILSKCSASDPPFLSDLVLGVHHGTQPLMIALAAREEEERDLPEEAIFRWNIKVLRDEWGNLPVPGEYIIRRIQLSLYKKEGVPYTGKELSYMKMTGEYEKRLIKKVPYKIDERGCISCGFRDAVYFLNTWGVHGRTGYPMTSKPEHSSDVVMCADRQKRHVHYWKYMEKDNDSYDELPLIDKDEEDKKPRRGRPALQSAK